MKALFRRFRRTIIFLIKVALYLSLLLSFFLIMGIENWQLLNISRTAGITLSTFVIMGLAMTMAYGQFDIGKRKSKPIISSIVLAALITDFVTYLQLIIMNTNQANQLKFRFTSLGLLVAVMIVQVILITLFTYGGNYVFFKMYAPERSCIITDSAESLNEIAKAVFAFKKQYRICYAKDYRAEDLNKTILKCDTVFLYNVPVAERTMIMEFCYRNMRNVYISPEIADIVELNSKHVILDDISLISSPVKELSFEQKMIKRFMDIVISLLALIILSPVIAICAISIKICDGGSVIFKQNRATKGGQVFEVYKFRTMKENVENYSSTSHDDRITPVGHVLRKYRLDELPQFLNILKGEMSMVGPRPEMLENVYLYTKDFPEFEYRLRVKAGLTGYAQIAGKYNTTPKYKLVLDLMYIENYSILRDIKLLFQTLIVLFKADSTEGFAVKKVVNTWGLDAQTNDWWSEYEQ